MKTIPTCRLCNASASPENPIDFHSDACLRCIEKDAQADRIRELEDALRCMVAMVGGEDGHMGTLDHARQVLTGGDK